MKIGIPKEIKNNENRVSCTPAGVFALCKAGHDGGRDRPAIQVQ